MSMVERERHGVMNRLVEHAAIVGRNVVGIEEEAFLYCRSLNFSRKSFKSRVKANASVPLTYIS